MRHLEKLTISHPLAHCEAAKAYYYAWVEVAIAHPPGSNVCVAANEVYQNHWATCEICIEEEGLHGNKEVRKVRADVIAG